MIKWLEKLNYSWPISEWEINLEGRLLACWIGEFSNGTKKQAAMIYVQAIMPYFELLIISP